jgi:hypothetical protein
MSLVHPISPLLSVISAMFVTQLTVDYNFGFPPLHYYQPFQMSIGLVVWMTGDPQGAMLSSMEIT